MAVKRALPIVLFIAAALYFSLSRNLTLDLTDEGQIVYPSWLVASGAIPHRDFQHLYGPSLFLFNGTVLSVFGVDLAVLRWLLVLIKAAVVTVVFLASRTVASPLCALLAYGFCVSVWGTPWWVFNAPYANHYALLLTMLGVVLYWTLRAHFFVACVVTGLCFGLASTFKPTSGVFAALAFALFLIWDSQTETEPPAPHYVDRGIRALRILALVAVALVSAVYLAPRNTVWNALMLLAPLALTLAILAGRELRISKAEGPAPSGPHGPPLHVKRPGHDGACPSNRASSLVGMIAAGAGMLIPVLGYVFYYAMVGGLASLGADLLAELPSRIQWFTPLGVPEIRPTLVVVAICAGLVALRMWRSDDSRTRMMAFVALAIGLASAAVLLRQTIVAPGLRAYALMMYWHDDLTPLVYVVPFAVVWASAGAVLRNTHRAPSALGLFYFLALISLLFLYPAADFWHLIMGLPAFMPLLAYQLDRYAAPDPARTRVVGLVLIGVIVFVLSAPFINTLRFTLRTPVTSPALLTRATGIATSTPKFADTVALMGYLDAEPGDVSLLTLANEQMLYFLSGRRSAASEDEFVLYLIGSASIADEDARALVSPQQLIERIQAAKPLIVDDTEGPIAGRFQRVFPEVAAFVATHYRPAHTAGSFRVLRWTDA